MSADRQAPAVADAAPHRASVADRDLLGQLMQATRWWAGQRTRRVSSSHTGGGVIEALEAAVAARVGPGTSALALPSGTAALLAALAAIGVGPGDRVGVPAVDWTASGAVLRTLGATPVPLPVHPDTGILDPSQLDASQLDASRGGRSGSHRSETTGLTAMIAVHLHGLTCDVPALRRACPGIPVVEDAARAWAACYPDATPVGSAADACGFSFGSAKVPGAGELGCLVTQDLAVYRAAVRHTQHPTRQLLAGVPDPCHDHVMTRVAPAVALLGGYVLTEHAEAIPALRRSAARAAAVLRAAGMTVLTDPGLHVPGTVAVRADRSDVRAVLAGAGVACIAVDSADVTVHPHCPPELAGALRVDKLTVVTVSAGAVPYHAVMGASS
jgi:hypothetical protein